MSQVRPTHKKNRIKLQGRAKYLTKDDTYDIEGTKIRKEQSEEERDQEKRRERQRVTFAVCINGTRESLAFCTLDELEQTTSDRSLPLINFYPGKNKRCSFHSHAACLYFSLKQPRCTVHCFVLCSANKRVALPLAN